MRIYYDAGTSCCWVFVCVFVCVNNAQCVCASVCFFSFVVNLDSARVQNYKLLERGVNFCDTKAESP